MRCFVGIDIGAVSATAALLVDCALSPSAGFTALPSPEGQYRIYLSEYRRTRGRPIEAAKALLEQVVAAVGGEGVAGIYLTGGASKLAAGAMGTPIVNEFQAIALGLSAADVDAQCVFEMGGESSKFLRLARNGDGQYSIADYSTNGDCAAGTGAFLDQQAGRLQFAIEDVGELVLGSARSAQVAGRCSVFAKSDMIHAQQKGYKPPEVLAGLCDAVARNFRSAVVRSHQVAAPVALIGGVAANQAVVRSLRQAFELNEKQLIVPDGFAHMPAIGAAVAASRHADGAALSRLSNLKVASDTAGDAFPRQEPLSLHNVLLLRDHVQARELPPGDKPVDGYLGIDIGSVSTNVVVLDEDGAVIVDIYTRTLGRPIEVVTEALRQVQRDWGDRLRIRGAGTTGSGRELIGQLIGADTVNDEITCHKTGATYVGRMMLDGRVPDTIFEIGGQDSKFIALQDGVVVDFTMNEACAAGTGSFLEERAEELDIAIKGEFAALAMSSKAPIRLGERCTVFMERDVNSYLQRGASKADLVAGLAYSVVYNYINRVVRGRKLGDTVFFQGGTAYNDAVAAAFAAVTGKQIIVPPHNGVIGAIGAALLARDKMRATLIAVPDEGERVSVIADAVENESRNSKFRGYDVSKVHYGLREFTCKACSNACQIQEFNVEGEKTYWGDKCSDRYRKQATAERTPVIDDLFALRQKLLLDESHLPMMSAGAKTVGIPMTMFALEQLPFWRTLLSRCGFHTVLSDPTNKRIIHAGQDAVVAEPCFPILVAHGHVADLGERGVDYILAPNIVSAETQWTHTQSHLCPWHQTLPFVLRRAPRLEKFAPKFLTPTLRFRDGRPAVTKVLREFFRGMGIPAKTVEHAAEEAFAAQDRFDAAKLHAGQAALDKLTTTGEPGIVLVGRPYNVHDAGVNLSVARKLRDQYGVNVIPFDMLDLDAVDVRPINDHMFWNLGRRLLAAARIVADHPNLHIIHITNFKCGPDSFIKHFIRPASGKPFLTLQFDGHSNDAGMMTRCEAYLDSKGILRPWRSEEPAQVTV